MGRRGRSPQHSIDVGMRCGPQPAIELASAGPTAMQNMGCRYPHGESVQLVFEMSSAATSTVGGGSLRLAARRPAAARARALAAIHSFGQLEGIHQRSAPLRTVTRHLAAPFARAIAATAAAVEQTPLEARRFAAGAIAGMSCCLTARVSLTRDMCVELYRVRCPTLLTVLLRHGCRRRQQDGNCALGEAPNAADDQWQGKTH